MVRRRRLLADLGFPITPMLAHGLAREVDATKCRPWHLEAGPAQGNGKLKGKGNGRLGRAASLQKYVHRSADATNLKAAHRALPGAVCAAAYAPAFLRFKLRRCPTEPAGAHWQTPRQLQAHGSCQWAEPLDSRRESRAQEGGVTATGSGVRHRGQTRAPLRSRGGARAHCQWATVAAEACAVVADRRWEVRGRARRPGAAPAPLARRPGPAGRLSSMGD
jgi:hypothetical protein